MEIIKLEDYNIYVGHIEQAIRVLVKDANYSKVFVLVDENTKQHCLPILEGFLKGVELIQIEILSGEQNKHLQTCQNIWKVLMDHQADRKALLINLGGGVIGDMGGFCACTYKRGIEFIQIPTTLLSQVDSSIGGKLGIDFANVKNSIGIFKNPQAVFIDPVFLKTLDPREIRSGFAEMIKHSLIADRKQWELLSGIKDLETVNWASLIVPSLMIKKRIVEEDPFEKGIRKALNFGHTIGHAVESHFLMGENPLLHGEAIAVGMIGETYLSSKLQQLSTPDLQRIKAFIQSIYGSPLLTAQDFPTLLNYMGNDKKNEGGTINFSLIEPIGSVHINQTASHDLIIDALEFCNS